MTIPQEPSVSISDVPFSHDLVLPSKQLIAFLQGMHATGVTLIKPSDPNLERYINYWLPLVAQHPHQSLVPPPDVAWLWHCHRLSPMTYEKYCMAQYGAILDANPPFQFQAENCSMLPIYTDTLQLWSSTHGSGRPFFLTELTKSMATQPESALGLLDGFDLIASTERQKEFLWHVSQPYYTDDQFLTEAMTKYHKFLQLMPEMKMPIIPTFQVDLMWHTHILISTTYYHAGCVKIRGEKFDHDDSFDDRTPGAVLDQAFHEAIRLWKNQYGEDYVCTLGNYCGEPPEAFYCADWDPANPYVVNMNTSFSRTKQESNVATPWADPKLELLRNGKELFIPANPKSRKKSVNSNPQMDGYVFGKGFKGDGYYSLETEEAYKIMLRRLRRHHAIQKNCYDTYDCNNCLCLGWTAPTKSQIEQKKGIKSRIDNLACMVAYVQARLEYGSPHGEVPEALVQKYLAGNRDTHQDTNRSTSSDNTDTMMPMAGAYLFVTPFGFSNEQLCKTGGCGGGGAYG
jgi:hypothetical protein